MAGVCILLILSIFFRSSVSVFDHLIDLDVIKPSTYVFWPNATIPFYVNPDHFDREQTLAIMTTLSLFATSTCLKFSPVLVSPEGNQHVMVFQNRDARKHCSLGKRAHSLIEPHYVDLGYDCLRSPHLELAVMRALGFPFEHNRMSRDLYIDVQPQNVAAGAEELFIKDLSLPAELRNLPYDFDSVMHFGEREYSKNGHRTIIFKNPYTKQNRVGLTPLDVRKVSIVYGRECRTRDRQEKIELCQGYPGVARRKREAAANPDDNPEVTRSLRVNPDITPPPEVANKTSDNNDEKKLNNDTTGVDAHLKELGIEDEVQEIVDKLNKISATVLSKARVKLCNDTKPAILRSDDAHEILDIVKSIALYTQGILYTASQNRTEFCQASKSVATYLRYGCQEGADERCRWNQRYKSTKFGPVHKYTQQRPWIRQSTKNSDLNKRNIYESAYAYRATSDNSSEVEKATEKARKKREAYTQTKGESVTKESVDTKKSDGRRYGATEFKEKDDYDDDRMQSRPKNNNKKKYWSDEEKTQKKSNKDYDYDRPREGKPKGHGNNKYESQETYGRNKYKGSAEKVRQFEPEHSREGYSEEGRSVKKQTYADDSNERPNKKYQNSDSQERRKPEYDQNSSPEETYQSKGPNKLRLASSEEKIEPKPSKKKGTEASEWKKKTEKDLPKVVTLTKGKKEFYNDRKWPDGVVRFFISDQPQYDLDDLRARLQEVNHILRKKTCVRLQEVTPKDGHHDYLVLDTSPDYVTGRVGGKQIFGSVELFQGGQHRQHTAMMVMAMLGFYFEVAREDRDKYVRVHMRHVRPDKLHHFEMIREDATLPLPYDYASATHPAWQFWRRIGQTGISSVATYKDQDPHGTIMKSLGQNEQLLSNIDIIKINSVYGTDCFNSRRKADTGEKGKIL